MLYIYSLKAIESDTNCIYMPSIMNSAQKSRLKSRNCVNSITIPTRVRGD